MAEYAGAWAQSTSPRDQDEEYEGEGDLQAREADLVPVETKYWRIQPISGESKPKWRNCHTAVLQNDSKMIIFGGMHRKSKLNDCYVCDLDKNEWQELRALNPPSARYCHTANLYKNQYMLVFGGLGDRGERFNDLCVLDLKANEWLQPATAGTSPEPRSHHGSIIIGDKLIIFGGLSGLSAERLNAIHILDLEKRPWTWSHPTTLGIPPTGRLYPTLAVWKNQLSVFAGYTGKHRLNDMHMLDLGTMTWSEAWPRDERPNPVYGHSGTQLGSKLLVLGGNTGVSYYEHHLYMLDFETMLWRRLEGVDCPSGRRYHSAILSNATQKLYVYGGSTVAKAPEDFLYVLDTTLIPGLEEWTFDEAQDIIKQGIRSFTKLLKNSFSHQNPQISSGASSSLQTSNLPAPPLASSSSNGSFSSSAIDIPSSSSKSGREKNSKVATPSSPSSPSGTHIAASSSAGSLRKRKKSRSDLSAIIGPREILVEPNASTTSTSASSSFIHDSSVEDQASEAVRLLKLHFKRLKREKEELRAAAEHFQLQQRLFKETIAQMGKYMEEHSEGNVVKLNVGGVAYQTTLTTLTSHPDSMLSAMFSGRYKLPKDEKGRIFIDRDGTHFRHILNFLRDGTLNVPSDPILLVDLLRESQFYQLHELAILIKRQLKEKRDGQMVEPKILSDDLARRFVFGLSEEI
jgi:hypothetical protein